MKHFNFKSRELAENQSHRNPQFGGALLSAVATTGLVMVLVQGTLFYRSKTSNQYLLSERNKTVATQLAEAGIEENIADFGMRKLTVTPGMADYPTYNGKALLNGTYTTRVTTLGIGSKSDTVNVVSTGSAESKSITITARVKLNKYIDTTRTPLMVSTPVVTTTFRDTTIYTTTSTTTVQDPNTMPSLNTTVAYAACMGSSAKKCDVCHLPGGDLTKANVINISKSAIGTHISHHGDYVTTDGTCDIYKPKTVTTVTSRVESVPVTTSTVVITYDTLRAIDTLIKTQILSWR